MTKTNTANFFKDDYIPNGYDDGFAVTGSPGFNSSQNYLTDVGVYTASLSPYGTFDQGGNVWEWNEAVINSSFRGLRGGIWGNDFNDLAASNRFRDVPELKNSVIGFRVASIPEPSTGLRGLLGAGGLLLRRRQLAR